MARTSLDVNLNVLTLSETIVAGSPLLLENRLNANRKASAFKP